MDQPIFIYFALTIVGLCLGSFAGASVWRLRSSQLRDDKKIGEPVDESEYKRLEKLTKHKKIAADHSVCLDCNYRLEWYDLVPLFSWLLLRGKCRKCRKPIGYMEPLIEIGVAVFFVLSYMFWPYSLSNTIGILMLIIWLLAGVGLAVLFAYDTKWSLLPDKVNFLVIGLGFIFAALAATRSGNVLGTVYSTIGAVAILSGIYLVLYVISKGKWIGFGDIKLGLGLGLLLGDWRLAFIALFMANFVGSLMVIPPMLMGKLKRNSHVPFGPLLIIGFFIAALSGNYILSLFLYAPM
jgi:prepilin signal peptidase PulO-like enzyme (type II secretory pathway)